MAIKKKTTPAGSGKRIIPDPTNADNDASSVDGMQKGVQEGQLAVDVFQTPKDIIVVAPLAGVQQKDMSISVNKNVLTIRGQRSFHFEVKQEDYFTQECFWGGFSRSIILPESVDSSKIKANFRDSILVITIPKTEHISVRTISIEQA